MSGNKDRTLHRRAFFEALFSKAAEPVARAAEHAWARLEQALPPAKTAARGARPPTAWAPAEPLRPPGALPEEEFLAACVRSGQCVRSCPVKAIKPLPSANPATRRTPHIEPEIQACVVCDDLSCMKNCPSGALRLTDRAAIRMGLATVHFTRCLRSDGQNCLECVDRCPIGETALHLDDHGAVFVERGGCVGCGVCAMVCPTRPRAVQMASAVSLSGA